mmetsp:Transcript_104271/g.185321  ORF Transcript_104271/g.185321 Transcript_104271/m.185321 type:complete len:515 (-) Transcript_104271:306-1850(-)|eukprot:CAMPEP_0197638354 /NCGR_PEP_ID=MMETSP1338-20131121/13305_1 /TAXON_ID=43686 ORGANISM="Pelagodinium beii, Strain RCC1491" /NCGR_SAMPLE_ID=MMETSP1338 /ASSEMBLY_ACC=CAM_ASM_000754 /LENGTH=514 /DNA_ID=CAMNT_0043210911 /DNA_START=61 /DNA_END=1605 /DNA_ORIENTATION=-
MEPRPATAPSSNGAETSVLEQTPSGASKHFSLEGEATPERLTSNPKKLQKLHEELRTNLMEAIRKGEHWWIKSLVTRGASLLPHYYSARLGGKAADFRATSKGLRSGLVNPVDWAALEGCFKEAMLLLELADGKLVFGRDESQSFLTVLELAKQCRRAVAVAAGKGQVQFLQMLLERGADSAQQNFQGETALQIAVRAGKQEVVEILLQFGAWELEPRKQDVLARAEAQRMLEIVKAAGHLADRSTEDVIEGSRPRWTDMVRDLAASNEVDKDFTLSCIKDKTGSPRTSRPASRNSPRRSSLTPTQPCLDISPPNELADERAALGPVETWTQIRMERAELHAELVRAIRKGDRAKVVSLVRHGASLDLVFKLGYGETGNCIDWACVCERPLVALTLFELADEQGLGEMLATDANAALFWSVVHGYMEVLRALLSRGADAGQEGPAGKFGSSVLMLAVTSWRPAEVRELLAHGAWQREPNTRKLDLLRLVRDRGGDIRAAFMEAGIDVNEILPSA